MNSIYQDILKIANEALKEKDYFYIAIDGASKSGKTKLANDLKRYLDATVIPMSDYLFNVEQLDEERLSELGGVVDYKRFIDEIVKHKDEERIIHFVYDRTNLSMIGPKEIVKKPIVIVEGTYALHTTIKDLYDLNILLKVSDELQLERLKESNELGYKRFIKKMLPLEKEYLSKSNLEEIADIVIENE